MATEFDSDTLRSYTVEALKKLCTERHIAVYGKRKEELIAALSETPTAEFGAEQRVDDLPTGSGPLELVGLVMQMQREQMHWMAEQQRRQEEWMVAQQEAQRELWEGIRRHQEGGRIAAEEARRASRIPKPMLQKFTEKDDIESYLDMFERVARQQEWPRETWATQLAGLLSGNALDCYSSLPSDRSMDYDYVKTTILRRYEVTTETYRRRFREATKEPTESYRNFAECLADRLGRWEKSAEVDLREMVLLEQFLTALPRELALKVREGKPDSIKQAAVLADNYESARKSVQSERSHKDVPVMDVPVRDVLVKSSIGWEQERRSPGAARSKTNNRGDIQCFLCKKYGHIAVNCPLKAQQSVRARSKPALIACSNPGEKLALREGYLEGKPVQILVDSGSEITVVKASLVDPNRWNREELVRVQCVHGNEILYPSAQVRLETDGWGRTMKVALIPEVPVDVLLGV